MGDLSEIGPDGRAAVTIQVAPHWIDHHFQGQAVLPAVEAMQLLAHWMGRLRPGMPVGHIQAAAFDKFLAMPPAGEKIQAWCELRQQPDGALAAALLTRTQARSGGMSRTKIHARVEFQSAAPSPGPMALDLAAALDGACLQVAPRALYRDLVPFGPGFQTIDQPVRLTAEGALALIRAPERWDGQTELPLGSPFVLDAAFHAACVWSQRYAGVVAFPVGIARRAVLVPTRPGDTYVARVFPVPSRDPVMLVFDIWILDFDGRPYELLQGVRMRDVSGGRLQPPAWIRAAEAENTLQGIAARCDALVLIERATLMPFAGQCLSEAEARRTVKMVPKRLADYLSSRLSCKRLVRKLTGGDGRTPAHAISTLAADGIRPACPLTAGGAAYCCSVAHDRRYTVAVAAAEAIGVDVEPLDDRILKSLRIFMDDREQAAVQASDLGAVAAAVRVWTIKEAVAKRLDIHLADAWTRVRVAAIGAEQSRVRIDDTTEAVVIHQQVGAHVITLSGET